MTILELLYKIITHLDSSLTIDQCRKAIRQDIVNCINELERRCNNTFNIKEDL